MSYDPRCDCANSGKGIRTQMPNGTSYRVFCTRCKVSTFATANTDGYATLWTHLRPSKTLADRH